MGAFAVSVDGSEHACRFPATGRPAYEVLYCVDGPGPCLENQLSGAENFRSSPHTHPFFRQQGVDPISTPSVAAGATGVPQHEFAMLNGHEELERHSVGSHLEAWKLPNRRFRTNANHAWRAGIRLRPQSRGASSTWVQWVISTPPAMRKTSVPESLAFLRAPGQIAPPYSMHTHAALDFSRMAL